MQTGSLEWKRLIRDGATEMGIALKQEAIEQFAMHALELLRWAKRINLTAITDPEEMGIKHYLDSIAPVPWMSGSGTRLLDIGTGGGFPGLPIKVCVPAVEASLIDGSRKKISFLKHVIRILGLEKVEAVQARAENLPPVQSFDIIVSRAVSDMNRLCRLADPLLSPDGTIIGFIGKQEGRALELDDHRYETTIKPYELPYSNFQRALVFLRRR